MTTSFDIRTMVVGSAPYPDFLAEKIVNTQIDLNQIGTSEATNYLGMPYFMDLYVTLPSGEEVRFPHEPLISWGLRKTIVKTRMAGGNRKGSVKEFIETEDYDINISGACLDPMNPDQYPTEQVKLIKKIVDVNAALPVRNDLLNLFGIESIVFEACSWHEMKGKQGSQFYFMRAVSDSDFFADRNDNPNLQGL